MNSAAIHPFQINGGMQCFVCIDVSTVDSTVSAY